jgi:hypothetical protein
MARREAAVVAKLATFRRKIRVFGRMAYGGGKGKSPPGGAWRAGAAKIAGWRL